MINLILKINHFLRSNKKQKIYNYKLIKLNKITYIILKLNILHSII